MALHLRIQMSVHVWKTENRMTIQRNSSARQAVLTKFGVYEDHRHGKKEIV